jgi:hypothetical protein
MPLTGTNPLFTSMRLNSLPMQPAHFKPPAPAAVCILIQPQQMKKIILLAFFLAAWMCFVNAQSDTSHHSAPVHERFDPRTGTGWNRSGEGGNHPGRQPEAARGFGHMMPHHPMGGVHYSPEQMARLKEIGDQYRQQVLSLEKNDNITLKEYKARLAAIRLERKNRMQGILTE